MHVGDEVDPSFMEVDGIVREVRSDNEAIKVKPRNQGNPVTTNHVINKEPWRQTC